MCEGVKVLPLLFFNGLDCVRKSARGEVKVTMPGTGKFSINGKGLDYFETIQSRETVIAPLQLVGWLGTVDVEAFVRFARPDTIPDAHGETTHAGCVRWGIATGIAALGN